MSNLDFYIELLFEKISISLIDWRNDKTVR